jgi:hypothetical protein
MQVQFCISLTVITSTTKIVEVILKLFEMGYCGWPKVPQKKWFLFPPSLQENVELQPSRRT